MFEEDMIAVAIVVVVFAVLAYDLSFNHGEWLAMLGGFANEALREIRR
jgi:ammonia channel protein AmtB